MKKIFLLTAIVISCMMNAQTELETTKLENNQLKEKIAAMTSEIDYYKKILEINTPIFEFKKEGISFKITSIVGDKQNQSLQIKMLVENSIQDSHLTMQDFSIVDLEGNDFPLDLASSINVSPQLSTEVPIKVVLSLKNIEKQPKIIKLLRFKIINETNGETVERKKSTIECRDLPITWE